MPKACKEVFHPCAIETMHITIFLLVVTQFLATKKWQRRQNQKWLPHPCLLGGDNKIWHIPNAQEALKTELWNNRLVGKGQN